MKTQNENRFGVFGMRQWGERVYWCESPTQGNRFVPSASSYCWLGTKDQARATAAKLQESHPGLSIMVFNNQCWTPS